MARCTPPWCAHRTRMRGYLASTQRRRGPCPASPRFSPARIAPACTRSRMSCWSPAAPTSPCPTATGRRSSRRRMCRCRATRCAMSARWSPWFWPTAPAARGTVPILSSSSTIRSPPSRARWMPWRRMRRWFGSRLAATPISMRTSEMQPPPRRPSQGLPMSYACPPGCRASPARLWSRMARWRNPKRGAPCSTPRAASAAACARTSPPCSGNPRRPCISSSPMSAAISAPRTTCTQSIHCWYGLPPDYGARCAGSPTGRKASCRTTRRAT